jgi:hypothetical protein
LKGVKAKGCKDKNSSTKAFGPCLLEIMQSS